MRAFAYRLLGRREYGIHELSQRLRQKFPNARRDPDDISELVDALIEENLVSDERFAESFVRSRANRHQGPLKIKAALQAKGVSGSEVSQALSLYDGEWTNLAHNWVHRQLPEELSYEERGKWYRRLRNRGFTHDQAMDALNR